MNIVNVLANSCNFEIDKKIPRGFLDGILNRNCCLQLSHGAVTNEFLIKQHLEQLGIITAKKPVRDQREDFF